MTLTFAIPFFRNPAFLRRSIESVLRQTSHQWELLVCDEGVEEGIQTLVESYADSRLRYHRNPHPLGMVANWNQCLELAGSDWVTILHADDEILPEYAVTLTTALESFPEATAVFCRARVIDGKSRSVFSFPDFYKRWLIGTAHSPMVLHAEAALASLLRGCYLFCPTACLRKSKLGQERFSEKWKMVQDFDLWARLLLGNHQLVLVPQTAYAYRRHEGNSTTAYTRSLLRFHEEIALYHQLSETCSQKGWGLAARTARRGRVLQMHLAFRVVEDIARLRWKEAREKASLLAQIWAGSASLTP